MNPQILIEAVRSGKSRISELTFEEVEEIVFYQTAYHLKSKYAFPVQIRRFRRGIIDIVVEIFFGDVELGGVGSLDRKSQIFIECKHYNRNLELGVAAKVFCAAIRENPEKLIIVSSSLMSPQAWDYAHYFFNTERGRGYFKSIDFSVSSLEQVVGLSADSRHSQREDLERLPGINHESEALIIRWRLVQCEIIADIVLASEHSKPAMLRIWTGKDHMMEIEIRRGLAKRKWELKIRNSDGKFLQPLSPLGIELMDDQVAKLSFLIPKHSYSIDWSKGTLEFSLDCSEKDLSAVAKIRIEADFLEESTIVTEMRPSLEAERAAHSLLIADKRILLIFGEAGVGKSHEALKVCRQLAYEGGYRCHSVTVNDHTTDAVFFRLIWGLVVPNLNREISNRDEATSELLRSFFERLFEGYDSQASKEVTDKIMSGKIAEIDQEVIIFLCSRILASSPVPQIIWFRDCHWFSTHLVKGLQNLISSLTDLGWGNCRILLEFRDDNDGENSEWQTFESVLRSQQHSLVEALHLRPLTQVDLANSLELTFAGDLHWELAEILMKKSGGNPLFLSQLLLWSHDIGWVKRTPSESRPFIVADWNALQRELTSLPASLAGLLKRRMQSILAALGTSIKERPLAEQYLAIAAFWGTEFDESLIRSVTGFENADIEKIRTYFIQKGILAASLVNPPVEFVHEAMTQAAREFVVDLDSFKISMLSLERTLSHDEYDDTIVGGRINIALHKPREAFLWYEAGLRIAKAYGKFGHQLQCLEGCRKVLQSEYWLTYDFRKCVAVDLDLVWCEMQAGSLTNALKIVRDVEQKVTHVRGGLDITNDEQTMWQYQSSHLETVLSVKLIRPVETVVAATKALSFALEDKQKLATMTRLLLMSCMCNYPDVARELSRHCLALSSDIDADSLSSLYSDIGHVYLQTNPQQVQEFWQKALELPRARRQRSHSQIDFIVASLYTGKRLEQEDTLEKLAAEVAEQNTESQLARVNNCLGILSFHGGNHRLSKQYFSKALNQSRLLNQVYWEWKTHNNLAVLAILDHDEGRVISHFVAAYTLLQDVIETTALGRYEFESSVKSILKLSQIPSSEIVHFVPILDIESDFCGVYPVLISNIAHSCGFQSLGVASNVSSKLEEVQEKLPIVPHTSKLIVEAGSYGSYLFALE